MSLFGKARVYLVATNHPEFATQRYPKGSTVIDPWGVVPSQGGVSVRAVGRNKPTMISLLCPSRGRPSQFTRMAESAIETATYPRSIEIICYLDADDDYHYPVLPNVTYTLQERCLLSEAWNRCYALAKGEILMHCGDDIVFRTDGWDEMVRDEFARWPDRIVLVQGDDLSPNREVLATHGFLHRRWVETVGYFVPPLFSSDWNDVWLTEIADMLDRRVRLDFITEHMHYAFAKAEHDRTYAEREERGARDGVVELFKQTLPDRKADAAELRAAMT